MDPKDMRHIGIRWFNHKDMSQPTALALFLHDTLVRVPVRHRERDPAPTDQGSGSIGARPAQAHGAGGNKADSKSAKKRKEKAKVLGASQEEEGDGEADHACASQQTRDEHVASLSEDECRLGELATPEDSAKKRKKKRKKHHDESDSCTAEEDGKGSRTSERLELSSEAASANHGNYDEDQASAAEGVNAILIDQPVSAQPPTRLCCAIVFFVFERDIKWHGERAFRATMDGSRIYHISASAV